MNHKQIIDKVAFGKLGDAMEEDLARLVSSAMSFRKGGSIKDIPSYVLPKMLTRWNCVLLAKDGIAEYYKEKVVLTMATLFHKYGLRDENITNEAILAIDKLNDGVVLSDDFYRKSDEIKEFLKTKPIDLKRKPHIPDSVTFYRAKDIVSIQIEDSYYLGYIHKLTGVNDCPILEFYDKVFVEQPTIKDINNLKAKGEKYNDGIIRKSRFAIYGMKYQPDFANQIHLISSSVNSELIPDSDHLEESVGLYTVTDLFRIQGIIKKLFSN